MKWLIDLLLRRLAFGVGFRILCLAFSLSLLLGAGTSVLTGGGILMECLRLRQTMTDMEAVSYAMRISGHGASTLACLWVMAHLRAEVKSEV